MRRILQGSVIFLWGIGGLVELVPMLKYFDGPPWLNTIIALLWLTGTLPAFMFSIGYHESPKYRQTTVREDFVSAMSIFSDYMKYIAFMIALGAVTFAFIGMGYAD